MSPTATGSGLSDLLMSRSSTGLLTATFAAAVSLAGFTSGLVAATVTTALLVRVVPRVATVGRASMVSVCCAPTASVPRLQITWLLPAVVGALLGTVAQDPVDGVTFVTTRLSGSVSVMVVLSEELGPLLVAVITNVAI